MKLVVIASIIGAVALTGNIAAAATAARVTSEQLTDLCRPQLEKFVQLAIAEGANAEPATIPTDPAEAAEVAEAARQNEKDLAELRAQGINHPKLRELVDGMGVQASKGFTKEERQDLKRLKGDLAAAGGAIGPDEAIAYAAVCLMEAALADADGRTPTAGGSAVKGATTSPLASAAAVEARNKAAAEAAAVLPLRPTVAQEANNPANEASDCLEGIFHPEFVARGIKSNMQAVIRNKCARPVTVTWCIKGWDCKPGYSNLGTVPARDYLPVSFVYKGSTRIEYAGCYNGFVSGQGDLSKKLLHACK